MLIGIDGIVKDSSEFSQQEKDNLAYLNAYVYKLAFGSEPNFDEIEQRSREAFDAMIKQRQEEMQTTETHEQNDISKPEQPES